MYTSDVDKNAQPFNVRYNQSGMRIRNNATHHTDKLNICILYIDVYVHIGIIKKVLVNCYTQSVCAVQVSFIRVYTNARSCGNRIIQARNVRPPPPCNNVYMYMCIEILRLRYKVCRVFLFFFFFCLWHGSTSCISAI